MMLKLTKIAVLTPQTKNPWIFWVELSLDNRVWINNLVISIPTTKIIINMGYSFSGRSAHELSDIPRFQISAALGKTLQRLQN